MEVRKKLNSKPVLLAIVGPTASGKTALAIELAERLEGEIICADSRTVYKHLDIGTAKPTAEEQRRVRHHLLDVAEPDESFTVADFKQAANRAIEDISARGKLPILVGGSGLYVDAVLFDYQFSPENTERDQVNPRHVSREVSQIKSALRSNTILIGLDIPKDILVQRITTRVEGMMERGFLDEVRYLTERYPHSRALHAPGYKAFRRYLAGEISFDEAKDLFVRNDCQLAKRQMTWLRRNKQIRWHETPQEAFTEATSLLMDNKKSGRNNSIITTP